MTAFLIGLLAVAVGVALAALDRPPADHGRAEDPRPSAPTERVAEPVAPTERVAEPVAAG